jgi:hypothetical protein
MSFSHQGRVDMGGGAESNQLGEVSTFYNAPMNQRDQLLNKSMPQGQSWALVQTLREQKRHKCSRFNHFWFLPCAEDLAAMCKTNMRARQR